MVTRPARSGTALLAALERIVDDPAATAERAALLDALGSTALPSAAAVERLHDALNRLAAWPGDLGERARVERLLDRFGERADVARHLRALENSGIAGTDLRQNFFFDMACWLARRWPERLEVDWERFDGSSGLVDVLHLLLPGAESLAVDSLDRSAREWLEAVVAPGQTDAVFLVGRFARLAGEPALREQFYERIDPAFRFGLTGGAPSRTGARHSRSPVILRGAPTGRPDLRREVLRAPTKVHRARGSEALELIDLARSALASRNRDLDAFAHADRRDVERVVWPGGLEIVLFGVEPSRRLLLESLYGHLILQSGVPIGYGTLCSLFESSEVAFNLFAEFRGRGAAWVLARLLATAHDQFGATSFSLDPYQLGHDNDEGLRSGAWWFYEKLGFRPDAPEAKERYRLERRRARARPGHRSSLTTLRVLASHPVFLDLGPRREDVLGRLDLGAVGDAASKWLRRYGERREEGVRDAAAALLLLADEAPSARWSRDQRRALESWAPLLLALRGAARWPADSRRALAEIVRAKGGRAESDFVARFDAHPRLRRALIRIAAAGA